MEACRFGAISEDLVVNPMSCEGCGVCFHVCPEEAVILEEGINGRWFISETRFGPMVHAELFPGEENSGKLVALVRNQAKVLARSQKQVSDSRGWGSGSRLPGNLIGHRSGSRPDSD